MIEYVEGTNLGEWLRSKPSRSERIRLWRQLEDTMDYLQSRQTEHHDLKTDNILVTKDGKYLKLIDFGLSGTEAGRSDKEDLQQLMRRFFPSPVERVWVQHKRSIRAFLIYMSVGLMAVSMLLFGWMSHEQQAAQRQEQEMRIHVEKEVNKQIARLQDAADHAETFTEASQRIATIGMEAIHVGDSILSAYPEGHPYHYEAREIWNQKYVAAYNRIVEEAAKKPYK